MIKSVDTVRAPAVGAWCIPAQEHGQGKVYSGENTSGASAPRQGVCGQDREGGSEAAVSAAMAAQSISVSTQFLAHEVLTWRGERSGYWRSCVSVLESCNSALIPGKIIKESSTWR